MAQFMFVHTKTTPVIAPVRIVAPRLAIACAWPTRKPWTPFPYYHPIARGLPPHPQTLRWDERHKAGLA